MRNINNKLVLLIGLMVFAFSNVVNAQTTPPKRMWENRTYNLKVTKSLGSTYTWSLPTLGSGLSIVSGSDTATNNSFTDSSVFTLKITNSNASSASGSLQLREFNSSLCYNDNSLALSVFPMPAFTAPITPDFSYCEGLTLTTTGNINITPSNYSSFSGITTGSIVVYYQLFNSSGTAISGTAGSGTLSSGTLSFTTSTLSAALSTSLTAGDYYLTITGVSTNPTASTQAYAAGEINIANSTEFAASDRRVVHIKVNAVPAANTITPTN